MFDIKQAEAAWDRHNKAHLHSFLAKEDRLARREQLLEEAESRHYKELIADPGTIAEAICESVCDEPLRTALFAAFAEGDNSKLGAVIRGGIAAYITGLAAKFAEKDVGE